ncbi:hypothetical protein EW026_g170 [Hermanssonia centrifuga]|uniref:Uncharacterized protein n=1 Tax=Hermanssonia centrifuga TaxID=98765 RepID=A0A4S4KXB2_9APHY|nr:hypothetical protein EW026_g170 [Hermanssonia centrifuga]
MLMNSCRTDRIYLPETFLLRDTLYLLQGISGKYIHFASVKDPDANQLVFQEDSLTEYYRLIAILESQMPPSADGADGNPTGGSDTHTAREEESGMTLKRLDVWIQEWRLRMRMMSVCVEGARDTHGGALVNLIHGYADTGDPFVRKFTDQLLEEVEASMPSPLTYAKPIPQVSNPFFATLHKWLFSGELNDPFSEFFVAVDPELAHVQYVQQSSSGGQLAGDGGFGGLGAEGDDVSGEREGGLKLWEGKYQFQKDMLPAFVGEAFGRKVLTREKLSNTGGTLKYSDIAGLERSIDTAYQIASRRLFDIFFEKYGLLDHLRALKQYLLLGHGDFADQLMETLALARPANTLYRHNLTATLETAIRLSSAQNDPVDVVRRLDARMLEYSHGEIGWDVFTLEYKVDAPIDTVLDPEAMIKYLKLFNHLWKIKRIESTLSKGWMRIASGARTFLRVPGTRNYFPSSVIYLTVIPEELNHDWHQVQIVMAEMIHFIRQMEAYCQLEVIECSWKILLEFVHKKEGDLDALIEAHRAYLDRMVKKVLLLNPKAGREENLLNQVRELFSVILQFREATDDFYNYCLSESARRDAEKDEQRGIFTTVEPRHGPHTLSDILGRIKEYSSTFSERIQTIVQGLQSHADLDCRFLGVRLSFSDFYKAKKEPAQPRT